MTSSPLNAGREMDALIAEKVMGWTDFDWLAGYYATAIDPISKRRTAVPSFTTENNAALSVLDQIGGLVTITRGTRDGKPEWTVHLVALNEYWYAETLPLAICRAALAALSATEAGR